MGVITLTAVGYGDVYPVTAVGRALGAVISLLGVGLVALPAGILASGFVEEESRTDGFCPHCGEYVDELEDPAHYYAGDAGPQAPTGGTSQDGDAGARHHPKSESDRPAD